MKWTLENWTGLTFTFECGANTLTVIAKSLDEAVRIAKGLLREGVEIDVSGWDE